MRYTTRPISDRTWQRPGGRKRAQFRSTFSSTLYDLEYEVLHLRGRDVVLEVDVRERDIRRDGGLRADARPESPAVVVAFGTPDGPMQFRADKYTQWQDNVRAVALTLTSLRAVDRYGATDTGQQYTGFKALPPAGIALGAGMSVDDAVTFIVEHSGNVYAANYLLHNPDQMLAAYRLAAKRLHPDTSGGDHALFQKLQDAKRVLDGAR